MSRAIVCVACLLVSASVSLWTGRASAHALVDEARARMDDADWEAALAVFERAEQVTDLERTDLAELCVMRATVHLALGRDADARRDLAWLAAIDPGHALGPEVPPPVHEAFERARASVDAVSMSVDAASERGTAIRVRPDAPEGLVRVVRISYRPAGTDTWSVATGRELELPDARYDFYVELIGPGGVLLASEGSRDAPSHVGGSAPAAAVATSSGDDPTPWIVLGVTGGVVVIGLVVGLAVGLGTPSDQTAFGPPMVRTP